MNLLGCVALGIVGLCVLGKGRVYRSSKERICSSERVYIILRVEFGCKHCPRLDKGSKCNFLKFGDNFFAFWNCRFTCLIDESCRKFCARIFMQEKIIRWKIIKTKRYEDFHRPVWNSESSVSYKLFAGVKIVWHSGQVTRTTTRCWLISTIIIEASLIAQCIIG